MSFKVKLTYELNEEIYISSTTIARITAINLHGSCEKPTVRYELAYFVDGIYHSIWVDEVSIHDLVYQVKGDE